jgi:hypothetical protein
MMREERVNGRIVFLIVFIGVMVLLGHFLYLIPSSSYGNNSEIRPAPSVIPLDQPYPRGDVGNDTESPDANAGPDINVSQNTLVSFDGSGSTDNVGIVNYSWNYDDQGPKELFGIGPTYKFFYPGYFIITLKVTDEAGNLDIDILMVRVNDTEKPNASASIALQADEGRIVLLQGDNSKDNVGITNYTWTIDDNGIKTLFGKLSSYRFKNIINIKKFEITLNVTDAAGNWATVSNKINIYPDTDEPQINDRFPKNNQNNVNVEVNPRIMFDDDIDPVTIKGNVSIGISGKDTEVNFGWNLSDDGKELTLIPDKKLEENRIYTVTLTNKIKDMAGNNLSADNLELEFSFGTEDSFETLPFTIQPKDPKHGDNVTITINFNKDVDERTITPKTVKVTGPGGDVPLYISFTANKKQVSVTLIPLVESGERYILNISGNIKDTGGSALGVSRDFVFTCSNVDITENDEEPWNLFGLPIFFIFLFIIAIAVIAFTLYVIQERRKIGSGMDYDNAVNQLKSRKRQMDQLKRIEGEEKINENVPIKGIGDKDYSWKAEDIIPRKRSTPAPRGKVSYYNPQELSTFEGKTYDVAHPEKERSGRRRSTGQSSKRRGHRDFDEPVRHSRSSQSRRDFEESDRHSRSRRSRGGNDRRDRRSGPSPRASADVEWG